MHAMNGNTTNVTDVTSWSFGPQPALTMLHSIHASDHVSESHVRLTCSVLACHELPQAHQLLIIDKCVLDSSCFPILIHGPALHQRMLDRRRHCLPPARGLLAILGGRFCITSTTPNTDSMQAELARPDSPVNQALLSSSCADTHLHLFSTTSCFVQIRELAQALPYAPFWRVLPTIRTPWWEGGNAVAELACGGINGWAQAAHHLIKAGSYRVGCRGRAGQLGLERASCAL